MDLEKDETTDKGLRLAEAMNTYNHALATIREKGYRIYLFPDEREGYLGRFWAIKGKRDFIGSDPLILLGLIALWEHFGDSWRERKLPDIYDEILDIAYPEDDYASLSEEEFDCLVEHLRIFFDAIWRPLPPTISRSELSKLVNSFYLDF